MDRKTRYKLRINQGKKGDRIKLDLTIDEDLARRIINMVLLYQQDARLTPHYKQ
jgi:hypothetical protein